jgi:hypothetical protein
VDRGSTRATTFPWERIPADHCVSPFPRPDHAIGDSSVAVHHTSSAPQVALSDPTDSARSCERSSSRSSSDFATYREQFKRNALQAWLFGWTGDNGDPDNFLCVFFYNTTQNGRWDERGSR